MNQEELQNLSVSELVNLVLHLQTMNQQLQTNIASSVPVFDSQRYETNGSDPELTPKIDEQLYRTSLLLQLSIEFRETLEPTVIIERMLQVMASNLGISNASVVLIGIDGSVDMGISLREGEIRQVTKLSRNVLDRGLAGWVLRHGRSVVLPDVSRDKRWIPYADWQRTGSAIVLPIRQTQTTLGVLTIYHPSPQHFTSRDMLLMEGVAAQAGVALGAARRYQEESLRREQALALFAMSQFLTSERTYDDLAAMLQEKSVSIFSVDYGLLFLVQEHEKKLLPIAPPAELSQTLHKPMLLQATTMARKACGQKSIVTDLDEPHKPTQSFMAVPLLHSSTVIGAVVLIRMSGEAVSFSANMWSMLTTFMNVIAAACANMRLVDELKRYTGTLEHLVDERTQMLKKSRDCLRIVFDNLPDGLLLLDPQEQILVANNAFCYPIIGRHPRAIVGRELTEIWDELEQRGEFRIEKRQKQRLALTPGSQDSIRMFCTNSIGQKRWYEISRFSVTSDEGDVEYYIEQWFDITRQEELEHRVLLLDQQDMLGRLTTNVVLDVDHPIQEMTKNIQLSRELLPSNEEIQHYLLAAFETAGQIKQVLGSLRQLYQSSKIHWECVNINHLLRRLKDDATQQFRHLAFHLQIDERIPRIYGHPESLYLVLMGIIENAQDAMHDGGLITISSHWRPGEPGKTPSLCCISIHDTGTGIKSEHLSTIFDPFTSKKIHSTGINLYLSKQIIEHHQGRIAISSKEGEGTLVEVSLPPDERCRQKK